MQHNMDICKFNILSVEGLHTVLLRSHLLPASCFLFSAFPCKLLYNVIASVISGSSTEGFTVGQSSSRAFLKLAWVFSSLCKEKKKQRKFLWLYGSSATVNYIKSKNCFTYCESSRNVPLRWTRMRDGNLFIAYFSTRNVCSKE